MFLPVPDIVKIMYVNRRCFITWPAVLVIAVLVSACQRSQPGPSEIQSYIENYQIAHDYRVASMDYTIEPEIRGESGTISVSGKLELREPLYVEDLGSKTFRKRVAKMLRRNRFSEREIGHEIYDRVIRATARIPDRENEYYTFLKEEHAPGYAINFSADLIYKKGNDGFMLDGTVHHPKLQGARLIKFSNPVVDDARLVEQAVKSVLAEQSRYRELMKDSSAILSQLWDNEQGLIVWNRKVPYLGNENLSLNERAQLEEYSGWRGVYRISNIRPVPFNTPHASNFFELGGYTSEGIATCLRQTGFTKELKHSKSEFDEYCEFGKQYPATVKLASTLNDINKFEAVVEFEVSGISTGELLYDGQHFSREDNEVARFSDRQRVVFLEQPFDLSAHNRPVFRLIKNQNGSQDLLRLEYSGATDYELAGFQSTVVTDESVIAGKQNDTATVYQPVTVVENTDNSGNDRPAIEDSQESVVTPVGLLGESEAISESISPDGSDRQIERGELVQATAVSVEPTMPLTRKELVEAIQTELKRLSVYTARIDGIAGEQTFWAMNYVQKQLGRNDVNKPSQEFLTLLRETPDTAITPPAKSYRAVADGSANKKKQTIVGKAFGWVGNLFKKKDNKSKN